MMTKLFAVIFAALQLAAATSPSDWTEPGVAKSQETYIRMADQDVRGLLQSLNTTIETIQSLNDTIGKKSGLGALLGDPCLQACWDFHQSAIQKITAINSTVQTFQDFVSDIIPQAHDMEEKAAKVLMRQWMVQAKEAGERAAELSFQSLREGGEVLEVCDKRLRFGRNGSIGKAGREIRRGHFDEL